MNRLVLLALASIALVFVVGCGQPAEEPVPKTATEGGNVVQDEALKKQITGSSDSGGGQSSDKPTGG